MNEVWNEKYYMEYNEKTYQLNYADCCLTETSDIRELSEWADIIILTYDVSCKRSLVYCQVIYSQIRRLNHQKANRKTMFLIGCKSDLESVIDQRKFFVFFRFNFVILENLENFAEKFSMSDVISCMADSNETTQKVVS